MHFATPFAALVLALPAAPALADAVTYRGTIGSIPMVVELVVGASPDGVPLARYFYESRGVDIPLFGLGAEAGVFFLEEKAPCTPETCGGTPEDIEFAPTSGVWELAIVDDGARLTGTWEDAEATKSLAVALERVGARPFELADYSTHDDLAHVALDALLNGAPLTPETAPYDALRMQIVTLEAAGEVGFDGTTVRYVVDPRTRFRFPRIERLADGSDAGAANLHLEQRHWAMSTDALGCLSRQYPGMGWTGYLDEAFATLGGYADETVEVTYASPTVLSWTESGSLYCGGAHPYNHHEYYSLDVKSGRPLDLSLILSGWVAQTYDGEAVDPAVARANPAGYRWGPSDDLVAFIEAQQPAHHESFEGDCAGADILREYLAIGFKAGERIVFGLGGLPHVMAACGDDLLEIPLADVPTDLLAPTAAAYFPALTPAE